MKKIFLLFFVVISYNVVAITYKVTLPTDDHFPASGGVAVYKNTGNLTTLEGELRWAIYQANNNPGVDNITFQLPSGAFPLTITLQHTGILITEDLIIDGNTQVAGTGNLDLNKIKISVNRTGYQTQSTLSNNNFPFSNPGVFFVNNLVGKNTVGSKIENLTFENTLIAATNNHGIGINFFNTSTNLVNGCVFEVLYVGIAFAETCKSNIVKASYFGTNKSKAITDNDKMEVGIYFFGTSIRQPTDNIIGGGAVSTDKNYFYCIRNKNPQTADAIRVFSGSENKIWDNVFIACRKNINLFYPVCNTTTPGASNKCKQFAAINYATLGGTNGTDLSVKVTGKAGDDVEIYKTNSSIIDAVQFVGRVKIPVGAVSAVFSQASSLCKIGEMLIVTSTESKGNTSEFNPQAVEITGCKKCTTVPTINVSSGVLQPNTNITFTASTGTCNFNIPSAWLWNYGDGTAPTSSNIHSFASPGSYTVKLYVPAANGCPEIASTKTIIINAILQPACNYCSSFTFYYPNTKICKGEKITFESYIANCAKSPTSLPVWNFRDGAVPSSDPSHIYSQAVLCTITISVP